MLFTLFSLTLSTLKECPHGTEYFFNTVIEKKIPSTGWYYFFTSHVLREDPLVFSIKADKPISLYVNLNAKCPDDMDPSHAEIPGGNVTTNVEIPVSHDVSIIVNGIRGNPGTPFKIKMLGQEKKKKKVPNGLKLALIFIVMFGTTMIYFLYCVVTPKKKEKED